MIAALRWIRSPAQTGALRALELETKASWTARWHDSVHTPAVLEGRTAPMLTKASAADGVAMAFLEAHAAIFGMDSARDELLVDRTDTDELGMVHVRYGQVSSGVHGVGTPPEPCTSTRADRWCASRVSTSRSRRPRTPRRRSR